MVDIMRGVNYYYKNASNGVNIEALDVDYGHEMSIALWEDVGSMTGVRIALPKDEAIKLAYEILSAMHEWPERR